MFYFSQGTLGGMYQMVFVEKVLFFKLSYLPTIFLKTYALNISQEEEFVVHGRSDQPKSELRSALADQIMEAANKNKPLKTAAYIYRPPPFEDNLDEVNIFQYRFETGLYPVH